MKACAALNMWVISVTLLVSKASGRLKLAVVRNMSFMFLTADVTQLLTSASKVAVFLNMSRVFTTLATSHPFKSLLKRSAEKNLWFIMVTDATYNMERQTVNFLLVWAQRRGAERVWV